MMTSCDGGPAGPGRKMMCAMTTPAELPSEDPPPRLGSPAAGRLGSGDDGDVVHRVLDVGHGLRDGELVELPIARLGPVLRTNPHVVHVHLLTSSQSSVLSIQADALHQVQLGVRGES